MTPYLTDRTLIRLTPDEISDPYPVIADFCNEYTPGQIREKLEELKDIAFCDDGIYNSQRKRADLIAFIKMLERTIEANHLITASNAGQTIL